VTRRVVAVLVRRAAPSTDFLSVPLGYFLRNFSFLSLSFFFLLGPYRRSEFKMRRRQTSGPRGLDQRELDPLHSFP
jgi:hypothetical protein